MYKFSYVSSVGGSAVVVSRQLFDQVLDNPQVAELCKGIVTGNDISLKRSLPAFCWHATFRNGKRNSFSAIPSGLAMIDIDHCDKPIELFDSVKDLAVECGLVAAHVTPSTKGVRMVFAMPDGMTIEGMQRWITEKLQLEGVDSCTKDLARLSFVVPRSYWFYIDYEALFGDKTMSDEMMSTNNVNQWDGSLIDKVNQRTVPSIDSSTMTMTNDYDLRSAEKRSSSSSKVIVEYETEYKGIPYTAIVEALETLYGGKPEHGNRNTQIFSMACQLRPICNDDPQWIAKILPNYGEAESRWMATIKSACLRNQVQNMSSMLRKAIEMAKNLTDDSSTMTNDSSTMTNDYDYDLGSAKKGSLSSSTVIVGSETPPEMPAKLPKLIRHLIKNVPEVCRASVANGVFPALATHLSDVTFPLIDGTKKEATFMCVNMARQSSGKASLNKPIEYIMADIKEQDEINRRREQEWKDSVGAKGSNKEKPKRPTDLCVQMICSDLTNAAFVQRMLDSGTKYLYTNLEELDLLKQLQTNGSKDVGKIICLCFDNGTYGQERVGLQSVTALLPLRWNWNASSTVEKGREFFRNRLIDGTLSRVNFCTIINDDTKEFRYGEYDQDYADVLKPYIANLNLCKGEIVCDKALAMARRLQKKCTEIGLQTEDVIYQEFSYRAVTIAYMKGIVLFIANDMTWDKSIEDFCEWSLNYDLWCKNYFFGDAIAEAHKLSAATKCTNRVNMLTCLPDSFTLADSQEVRRKQGKDIALTRHMLNVWISRGYITRNNETGGYEKTIKYKLRSQ